MGLTIPQVRTWTLTDLNTAATGLRTGSSTLASGAVSLIDRFAGLTPDHWDGDARDRAKIDARDHADKLTDRSRRWNNTAAVLDEAAQRLGLLRTSLLDTVDDPENTWM